MIETTYTEIEMRKIIKTTAQVAAKQALVSAGIDKTQVSRAEASRRFGRYAVDVWVKKGQIEIINRGGSSILNLMELELLAAVSDMNKQPNNKKVKQ